MATMTDILAEMEQAERPRRAERTRNEWEFQCLCGKRLCTVETEVVCSNCKRQIRLDVTPVSPLRRPAPAA
jgi:hypothetical protein